MEFKYACNINLICFIRQEKKLLRNTLLILPTEKKNRTISGERESRTHFYFALFLEVGIQCLSSGFHYEYFQMETKGVRTQKEVRLHDSLTRWLTIKKGCFHTVGKLYRAPVMGLWLVNASTIFKMVCELFLTQQFPLEQGHYWCCHSVLYNLALRFVEVKKSSQMLATIVNIACSFSGQLQWKQLGFNSSPLDPTNYLNVPSLKMSVIWPGGRHSSSPWGMPSESCIFFFQ